MTWEQLETSERSCLIDHIEAYVFDSGLVCVDELCSKIIDRKGSIWVARSMEIIEKHCHELVMFMWIHHIIALSWSNVSVRRGDYTYIQKDIVCSFEKRQQTLISE